MFFGKLLKRYKEKNCRILLIKDLIEWLSIDDKQKELYIESLEVLDDESLERFYNKLTSVIEIIEEDNVSKSFEEQKENIKQIDSKEQKEKKEEMASYNLILESI